MVFVKNVRPMGLSHPTGSPDRDSRINHLITEYKKVLTIWRTHCQNIFKGLQPLLEKAVLDIRNTYNVGNN